MLLKLHKVFLILILSVSMQGFTQTKMYKSLATEYISTGQVEWIERDITFSDSLITIKTITDSTTDIQEFLVIDSGKDEFLEAGLCKYYKCSSPDGKAISTFFIPLTLRVERIEALVPNKPGIEPQHYRFHID